MSERISGTRRIAIEKLSAYPANPRRGDVAAIRSSLERTGQYRALVVRSDTLEVLAGNHTLAAMRELGYEKALVHLVDVDDEQARRIVLADNRTAELASYDEQALASLLAEMDGDLEGTGWDQGAVDQLLASMGADAGSDTEPGEVPEKPRTRPGDLWLLGEHRLLCGDCTSPDAVARLMEGERAKVMATDPPYGVSYADKNRFLNAVWPANRVEEPILSDHQSPEAMGLFWTAAFGTVRAAMAPGGSYYVTGPQGGDLLLLLLSLQEAGFPLRHMLIWAKNQFVIGRSDYHYQHEPIIYGWVKGAGHKFYGGRGEASLWEIPKPHNSDLHPTMKPVELYERAATNSSRPGDVILDPFAGSGSTLIAAENLKRRCYAMEIDPGYCDVICDRFERHTGTAPTLAPAPSSR